MFLLENIIRENISLMKAYSSARDEYKGEARIFLDANESAFGSLTIENYNRYPDPYQLKVKQKLSDIKQVSIENIFLGNGSDEAIDLIFRAFCEPAKDNVILLPPTYGMYQVAAQLNNIETIEIELSTEFDIDVEKILSAVNEHTKLIFVCSPNNPSGNQIADNKIVNLLNNFSGIVVLDEAYIDFASSPSFLDRLLEFENLIVLQTFSKAWGMAALRVGMAFSSKAIIQIFNKIKPPYNINELSQQKVLQALEFFPKLRNIIEDIKQQRVFLNSELKKFDFVLKIYPSDANFLLLNVENAVEIYNFLSKNGIIVRNRSNMPNCKSCLRITVGTKAENLELISVLANYSILKKNKNLTFN